MPRCFAFELPFFLFRHVLLINSAALTLRQAFRLPFDADALYCC